MVRDIAFIILAAGQSSRLGQPKQLVKFKESTLLENTIAQTQAFAVKSKFVILGEHRSRIKTLTNFKEYEIVINEDWERGFSSSMKAALNIIPQDTKGVVFFVADQPYLKSTLIQAILDKVDTNRMQIISSLYKIGQGPPVYFSHHFFNDILSLEGDVGAKTIVKANLDCVDFVEFIDGDIDIDTPKDLDQLNKKVNS